MNCAEDDACRSRYMQRLVRDAAGPEIATGGSSIPRVVIQYWHDAADVPEDVRECLESWKLLTTEGFNHVLFDDRSARRFIASHLGPRYVAAFDGCGHPAMRCDYFRMCYLVRYGGFYVDADEYYQGGDCTSLFQDDLLKVQPLCYDTSTDCMVPVDIFARRENHSPQWIYYVNNNPLVAPREHPALRLALARSTGLLSRQKGRLDIQGTTGPGNLTASLVAHAMTTDRERSGRDFSLLLDWDSLSVSRWPLSYRNDERNWRLWNPAAQDTPDRGKRP
jgi:mannosyltransferase OCH1-like enzyme